MIGHMIHGALKETWYMCLTKSMAELSRWKYVQSNGSKISKNKAARGLTDDCVADLILRVGDSFFKYFAAHKYKSYMRNGLKNYNNVPMKKVAARINMLH